jgi:hypothetical protein
MATAIDGSFRAHKAQTATSCFNRIIVPGQRFGCGGTMSDTDGKPYVAVFGLALGGGVTLERYRAPRGCLHMMRLVHQQSKISVEVEYNDSEGVLSLREELIRKLKARLTEKGLIWDPNQA